MPEKSSLINILCYGLPGGICHPMCNEFDARKAQIKQIWSKQYQKYMVLKEYESTIDALLAMSLFYRYVMGHIDGATSFYKSVNKLNGSNGECSIKIGSEILDKSQQNHMLASVITFSKIMKKYQLSSNFFKFKETIDFLKNCLNLYKTPEYETDDSI